MHKDIKTYRQTDIDTDRHTYIHTCTSTYIHTYIHTYIQAYNHTENIKEDRNTTYITQNTYKHNNIIIQTDGRTDGQTDRHKYIDK